MNIGAIAIGSNSTRLLTRLDSGLEDRAREDTRLFSGLTENTLLTRSSGSTLSGILCPIRRRKGPRQVPVLWPAL